MATINHSLNTCGVPEALTSINFLKCVNVSTRGQKKYFIKTHLQPSYLKDNSFLVSYLKILHINGNASYPQ